MKIMYTLVLVLSMATCLIFIISTSQLEAQESFAVTGKVVNETQGASIASELEILLHMLDQESGQFVTLEATTNDKGEFQFENVLLFKNGTYLVTADYGGTRYNTTIDPSSSVNKVRLSVYETTRDISTVRVEHHSLVLVNVDQRTQSATAASFVRLTNDTDLTILPDLENVGPGKFSFLRFSLPPNADNLDVQSSLVGSQIIPMGSGFALAAPILPGSHDISFSYQFTYHGTDLAYKHGLLQGADVFQILIPQSLSDVQVGLLGTVTPPSISNESYLIWEIADLTPGENQTVILSNLPKPNLIDRVIAGSANPDTWLLAIPIGMGSILILLLIWSIALRVGYRDPLLATESKEELPIDSSTVRDRLILEIASLDERHANGSLSETTDLETRSVLIQQVLAIDERINIIPNSRDADFNETQGEPRT